MLKRKIDYFLSNWKRQIDKKPLIISGARQVGKTTLIREFGKSYASFIEINFVTMPHCFLMRFSSALMLQLL